MGKGGLNRILLRRAEVRAAEAGGEHVELCASDTRAVHIVNILGGGKWGSARRGAGGDDVRVAVEGEFLLDGAKVELLDGGRVRVWLHGPRVPAAELPRITLVCALPRPRVLGRLLSWCGCVGVGSLILLDAEKVEGSYWGCKLLRSGAPDGDAWVPNGEMLAKLKDGVEQNSIDACLPAVALEKGGLEAFLRSCNAIAPPGWTRILAHPHSGGAVSAVLAAGATACGGAHGVVVAVGPEGGWMPEELEMLEAGGFARVSLGPRILRSDVAVLVLLGLIHEHLRVVEAASADGGEGDGVL